MGWSVERMIIRVNTANNPDFDDPSEGAYVYTYHIS